MTLWEHLMIKMEINLMCQDSQVSNLNATILIRVLLLYFIACKKQFTSLEMKLNYKEGDQGLIVSVRNKLDEDDKFQECFRIDQNIDLSYEKYFFVSALSGMALNNHHYIYGIKVVDLD